MASTLLNEQGWNRDAIERQLSHGERDAVRAAYNYAQHLPERRKMMQAWADYLDQLKALKPEGKPQGVDYPARRPMSKREAAVVGRSRALLEISPTVGNARLSR
jgi:hypothetical protein